MVSPIKHTEKMWGTSLYIGHLLLETRYGSFMAYSYQNVIHKGYIVALVKGDIHRQPLLYTRVHSSCVTSETLRSMDCDCVHQLEGALKKIADFGTGIFFYLIQEGRGCGYIGKSRACMHVQSQEDRITTFDAYSLLGMKADYRDYQNIFEVAKLLGVEKKDYTLITNNPDKIKGLQTIGLKVKNIQSIEISPGPFNQSYLLSKQQTGHLLHYAKKKLAKYKLKQPKVEPFVPYHLKDYRRFVHCASYYIPVKPVDRKMIFSKAEVASFEDKGIGIEWLQWIDQDNCFVKISEKSLSQFEIRPYWFKVYMYYDLATNSDYVILSYGDTSEKSPYVRIHSESLFNRFPLKKKQYSEKYKRALEEIVLNQSGLIVLLYHDGRGAGLGNYVLNQEKGLGSIGAKVDSRDYSAVAMLLEQHITGKKLKILYSQSSRVLLAQALSRQKLEVCEWLDLSQVDNQKGHRLIEKRIQDAPYYLLDLDIKKIIFDPQRKYIVTGIGSSEAHGRYLVYLVKVYHKNISIEFIPVSGCINHKEPKTTVIVISQGLSPNILPVFENYSYSDIILFTAVTNNNKNLQKQSVLERLQKKLCPVIHFPLEDEYTTLVRTVGPLAAYGVIYDSVAPGSYQDTSIDLFSQLTTACNFLPDSSFIKALSQCSRICFLLSYPLSTFFQNIIHKFEEGAFISHVQVSDYLQFAHGIYQNVEYQDNNNKNTCFILIENSSFDQRMIQRIEMLLEGRFPLWKLSCSLPSELSIFYFEMVFNHFILAYIKDKDIDQRSWHGRDKQDLVYSISSKKDLTEGLLN